MNHVLLTKTECDRLSSEMEPEVASKFHALLVPHGQYFMVELPALKALAANLQIRPLEPIVRSVQAGLTTNPSDCCG